MVEHILTGNREIVKRAIRMTALRGFLGHDLVVTLGGRHHIWQA